MHESPPNGKPRCVAPREGGQEPFIRVHCHRRSRVSELQKVLSALQGWGRRVSESRHPVASLSSIWWKDWPQRPDGCCARFVDSFIGTGRLPTDHIGGAFRSGAAGVRPPSPSADTSLPTRSAGASSHQGGGCLPQSLRGMPTRARAASVGEPKLDKSKRRADDASRDVIGIASLPVHSNHRESGWRDPSMRDFRAPSEFGLFVGSWKEMPIRRLGALIFAGPPSRRLILGARERRQRA